MRRLAVLAAVAAALLTGCGGHSSRHARLWLTPARAHVYTACVSQDCGPWQVTLNWLLPSFPNTTGYYTFLNGLQQADVSQGPFTYGGWDCGTTVTLGVKAHNSSGQASPLYTIDYTTPACAVADPALFHVAQVSAGTADGSSCGNASAVSTLSTSTHWTAGNVIGLCGTITSPIAAQGSGTSGNPITVYWEPGAALSEPFCGSGGCFGTNGQSYLTLNGGSNGSIQSTANGTGLANQQSAVRGISAFNCTGCTFENLTIANLYVRAQGDSGPADQTQNNAILWSGSNVTIADDTIHDVGWALFDEPNSNDGATTIDANNIYNTDHGFALGPTNDTGTKGPLLFYANNVHDYANWDNGGAFHHDGIHCYTSSTSGVPAHWSGIYIYNNTFGGNVGASTTAQIFIEGGTGTSATPCADSTSPMWIFNNVGSTTSDLSNGVFGIFSGVPHVLNNTLIAADTTGGVGYATGLSGGSGEDFRNDIVTTANQLMAVPSGIYATGAPDYNIYANGGSNAFHCNSNFFNFGQFANWQSCIGGDSHSSAPASASLNTDGSPQGGSPAIGAGTNLTSLCAGSVAPLCSEINGTGRPSTGAWNAGAY